MKKLCAKRPLLNLAIMPPITESDSIISDLGEKKKKRRKLPLRGVVQNPSDLTYRAKKKTIPRIRNKFQKQNSISPTCANRLNR